ncbi:MAG TPA: YoaK family protein, partial [Polyangiaceae bacterium]|nr:YoaK family protein [Polyangiaceae bacterium]
MLVLVPLRNTQSSRPPCAEVSEQRASRPSITPSTTPGNSLMPGASLLPSASVHLHSALLSAVAGYVDAAGFASLIGLFPAHLTGELVGDAIAFSSGHPRDHATHLWMLPVFVASVVAAAFVARVQRRSGHRPLAGLLALVTVALALFSLSDPLAHLLHESERVAMLVSGGCAVAAMGFQNALMRESLITSCPTTVMTGNVTLIVIDLADRVFGKLMRPSPHDRRPRSRLGPVSIALTAFLSCALLGGFLTRTLG